MRRFLSFRVAKSCIITQKRSLSAPSVPIYHPGHDLPFYNTTIMELARNGRVDDARLLFEEMPQRDTITWNSMISGYFQNGRIDEGRQLFDRFLGKTVRTWTLVLTGYARNSRIDDARCVFEAMPERNVVSWNAMLTAYVQNGDMEAAHKLFVEMPERNVVSWNALITGYCHFGCFKEALHLFEQMPEKNLVSWTAMISGFVHVEEFNRAWDLFVRMHATGVRPDRPNFTAAIVAVTGFTDLTMVEHIRSLAIKTGFEADVVVGTAILNAYTKCGVGFESAISFFKHMLQTNEFTWSTMIAAYSQCGRLDEACDLYQTIPEQSVFTQTAMMAGYAQNGRIDEATKLFKQIHSPNVVTWNAILTGCSQNGMLEEARRLFDRMPQRNMASWAAMIAGYSQNGQHEEALEIFSKLHKSGMVPSHSTFTSALNACANCEALEIGRQIHSLTFKAGCHSNSYVGNCLITMYAKCRNIDDFSRVFSRMAVRDTVSWNSLIAGFSLNQMMDDACFVFDRMPKRDAVSWTAMISAYVQGGYDKEAMGLFIDMLAAGTEPNSLTLTSTLSTCSNLGATKLGKQIHGLSTKLGLSSDLFVGNALISMYSKCGSMDAFVIFNEMPERDIVSWNAILAGCAQHGLGREAIEIYKQMQIAGVLPDRITFIGLLSACSHAGLVDEGWFYFNSMNQDYQLMPLEGHYACMVDLLGRAGNLYEAEELIESMPIEPDSVVWGALLGACRIHQNIELGRRVAERLFELEPCNSGNYILLSNIYASLGMWDEVGEIRRLMKARGVTKEPGYSWMQVKDKMHVFLTGDTRHEQIKEIHLKLKELYDELKAVGYVVDTHFALHDMEIEQKENALLYHSEKLAIAYGLLSTADGIPIQIMKNLRVCGDCHTFMKLVSRTTGREIIMRDGSRFHHFQSGACSCRDYW
ncbi:Pentatricopeptide repeat-containing protein [Nymphaea thermarum]|nr:Pentatricopeptide repeat-containing protein [Nymphaea thermarum]